MCWTRFFAVRVPGRINPPTKQRPPAYRRAPGRAGGIIRLLLGRGGPGPGDAARGGAGGGAGPADRRAVPRRRASVPTGLLCVIEGWANRDRGVALFTSTADDINNQLPGLGAREDARPTHSIPTVYLSIIGYIERYIGGAHGERTESADGSHGPTSRPDR